MNVPVELIASEDFQSMENFACVCVCVCVSMYVFYVCKHV